MSGQQQQQFTIIQVASSNCGLIGGKSGVNINRGVLNNHIIFFQELSMSGGRTYPNFQIIGNEYKKENDGARHKSNELQIAIDTRYFTLVSKVFTNDRIQIIKVKCIENEQDIILINCHIPQRLEKRDYLIMILKSFIKEMDILEYKFIIGGDFNTDYQKVSEIGSKFSNFRLQKTTPNGLKEIDFISTSNHFNFKSYIIDNKQEQYQTGNHYCLKAILEINEQQQQQQSNKINTDNIKPLNEIYNNCENESYHNSIISSLKKINNYNYKTSLQKDTVISIQPKKNQIEFTGGIIKFLNSNHSNHDLKSIYNSNLKGKLDYRTFNSFVLNKGERSRDGTKLIIIDALSDF